MSNLRAPQTIYLQTGDHNYDDLEGSDVTWCQNRINDTDLEYNISLPNPCTPEQYEEITGEKFPKDGVVWFWYEQRWRLDNYSNVLCNMKVHEYIYPIAIVQTGKGSPSKEWEEE